MSKLIVLSNRVHLPAHDHHPAGGLAVALQDALNEIGGTWLGWNGEKINDDQPQKFDDQRYKNVDYVTCPLNEKQYRQYYCGFSNNTLWPAMHDREDLIEFEPEEFETYQDVNRLFAEQLNQIAQPEDIIWVHDYHFLSVAAYCRQFGMQNRFGFFLHIPFANERIWKNLPVADHLIKDLCQYDVIGLQTEKDQQRCLALCRSLIKDSSKFMTNNFLELENRVVKIECYPIGINPDSIQKAALADESYLDDVFELQDQDPQKTIISVDRIDYSKGLIERFNAFSAFLKQYPEYHQTVTDLQIACPCRMDIPAYEKLYNRVKAKVDEINAEFGLDNWSPINCTNETIGHEQLMQLYRQSDICWVNSLKDGMNLVAKEYIAAQDDRDPGVLILSKYAGSADQMPEALIVDPNCSKSMVKALKKALMMSKSERTERYKELIKGLKNFDINDWRNTFLNDLRKVQHNILMNASLKKMPIHQAPSTF